MVTATLCVAIAVVHGGTIARNFGAVHWEDPLFFRHVQKISSPMEAFQQGSFWKGLYRPLSTNLYYYVGREWFGHRLTVYHAVNAALYLVNSLLAFWVCRSLASFGFSLAVAVLFTTRLANAEVPLYTSQIQSLLPVTFALLGLKSFTAALGRRHDVAWAGIAAACVLLALFSKESMVVLPAIYLVVAVFRLGDSARSEPGMVPRALLALALSAAALGLWVMIARQFLMIGDNRWWKYESSLLAIGGNYVAYALSFFNVLIHPVELVTPAVLLNTYPSLMHAHASAPLQLAFWTLLAVSAALLCYGAVKNSRWRPPEDLRWVAAGLLFSALALAPMMVFKDRLLMYYGYFGHFGLSIALVAAFRAPARLAARRIGVLLERFRAAPSL